MREFECRDSTIRIRRGAIDGFLEAFGPYRSRGEKVVLRAMGIDVLPTEQDATFPLMGYLDAMRELQNQFGSAFMRKTGTFIFEKTIFPPGLDTIEKAMASVGQAYYLNVLGDERTIGSYQWTVSGERRGVMFCDNPFPCAFDLGIFEGISRRFESSARVTHADGACRNKQGDSCSYAIEW